MANTRPAVWLLRNGSAFAACASLALLDRLIAPPGLAGLWWLAAGVALAAVARWGIGGWPGIAAAVLLSALLIVPPDAQALLQAGALALALLLAVPLTAGLRRLAPIVPVRLPFAHAAAGLLAAALVAAAMAGAAFAGAASGAGTLAMFAAGWAWSMVGVLLGALPLLAFDLSPPAPRHSARRRLAIAAAVLLALAGAAAAVAGGPARGAGFGVAVVALLALQWAAGSAAGLAGLALLAAVLAVTTGAFPGPALLLAADLAWALAALALGAGAMALSAAQLRRRTAAIDSAGIGVAEWRRDGGEAQFSAGWLALAPHGAAPPQRIDDWLQRVHADDRERVREAVERAQLSAGAAHRAELRMPGPDGWRWFDATLLGVEPDREGQPQRLLATLKDSGERHEALERQRLSASLFQHLHEGLLITDGELRVLDANPAYSQILGVPRAELLGSVPSLLRPTPADPLARQQRVAMWAALNREGRWRGELVERRRDGEICTLQATISTVHGPDLAVHHHLLVISDISEQRAQRERLERQAHFDELTRLPNRARLSQLLADALRAADRDGYLLAVCYLDLDRFKPVNDSFGHAAGDRLLAELASRLRSALRSRELWADAAARLGGDEFVLLLRAGTVEEARLAVERVLRVVALPYLIDPAHEPVHVTASVGATIYPIDHSDADTLLRHADHAMYDAKQAGRNGYLFFDPEHRRRTEQRVLAIGRVQEALDRAEFVLYYQPKVDMRSGRVLGLEALLRWDHPQQGMIAPMQFLPLIDNTGLSARVGDWVFSQALEHLAQWRRSGLDLSVSVNVSARHLQERDFAQRLAELLARHTEPLAPWLELEMLETAAHADIEATSALLARCRALGVRCALDDFGTGYSTLTYLKRLPVDVLKIDRSFVHHMLDDEQDRALVEGVIGLARTFSCTVVAEGVESPAQARLLLELGCDIGQGTGIAAPMPASQVAGWVRDWKGMFSLAPAAAAGDPHKLAG